MFFDILIKFCIFTDTPVINTSQMGKPTKNTAVELPQKSSLKSNQAKTATEKQDKVHPAETSTPHAVHKEMIQTTQFTDKTKTVVHPPNMAAFLNICDYFF